MKLSNGLSIASLIVSMATLIWIGGFRFSSLIHEVEDLGKRIDKLEIRMDDRLNKLEINMNIRFEKIENKLEQMQKDIHQLDVRVNTLEQRKR